MKTRHGEDSPQYATAINDLAQILQAANRLAEAEPLFRRALAINEKSYGPEEHQGNHRSQQSGAAPTGHKPSGESLATCASSLSMRKATAPKTPR